MRVRSARSEGRCPDSFPASIPLMSMIVTFKWALPVKQTNEFLISWKVRMSEMLRFGYAPASFGATASTTTSLPLPFWNSGRTSKDQRALRLWETQLTAIEHSKVQVLLLRIPGLHRKAAWFREIFSEPRRFAVGICDLPPQAQQGQHRRPEGNPCLFQSDVNALNVGYYKALRVWCPNESASNQQR